MGEARKEALRVDFDRRIKLEFHGVSVTSDAGLVAYRELDEAIRLTALADELFRDPRRGTNTQHELMGMLRQSVYSRLGGYEDTNDTERLAVDPAMRQVVGGRAKDRPGAGGSDNRKSAGPRRSCGTVRGLRRCPAENLRSENTCRSWSRFPQAAAGGSAVGLWTVCLIIRLPGR